MARLTEILTTLEFTKQQQVGITQTLVYAGCFGGKFTAKEKQQGHLKNVQDFEYKIPVGWSSFSGEQLSSDDSRINEILSRNFQIEPQALFQWLVSVTQLTMLGNADSKLQTHNQLENQEFSKASQWHTTVLNALGLTGEANWDEKNGNISEVLFNGNTQKSAAARLEHLQKNLKQFSAKKVKIYYLTNPRGLFNFEDSTAKILTNWFKIANNITLEKVDSLLVAINAVLSKEKDNGWNGLSWINNLSQLKKEILTQVQNSLDDASIKWPKAPDGAYDPIYDEVAKLDGNRDSFKDSWPTAIHMLQYLIDKYAPDYQLDAKQFEIVPVLVKGRVGPNGKYSVANTFDTLKAFKERYQATVESTLAVVADNSVTSSAQRQAYLTSSLLNGNIPFQVIHDAAKPEQINFEFVLKQLTKTLYGMKEANTFSSHKSPSVPHMTQYTLKGGTKKGISDERLKELCGHAATALLQLSRPFWIRTAADLDSNLEFEKNAFYERIRESWNLNIPDAISMITNTLDSPVLSGYGGGNDFNISQANRIKLNCVRDILRAIDNELHGKPDELRELVTKFAILYELKNYQLSFNLNWTMDEITTVNITGETDTEVKSLFGRFTRVLDNSLMYVSTSEKTLTIKSHTNLTKGLEDLIQKKQSRSYAPPPEKKYSPNQSSSTASSSPEFWKPPTSHKSEAVIDKNDLIKAFGLSINPDCISKIIEFKSSATLKIMFHRLNHPMYDMASVQTVYESLKASCPSVSVYEGDSFTEACVRIKNMDINEYNDLIQQKLEAQQTAFDSVR